MMSVTNRKRYQGDLSRNEPMAQHTSWRMGGPVDRYYHPAGRQDLSGFLGQLATTEPVMFLGLGSNLLVRDGGFRGTVIASRGLAAEPELVEPGLVYAEAGVPCAKLARFAARQALGEAAFFAGIPGAVGGALAMNAGAYGGETWERVEAVETVDRSGCLRRRPATDYHAGYRTLSGPAEEWFVAAYFRFPPDDADEAGRIRGLLARRNSAQPTRQPSAGSVFRNPPGDHAARLIEAAGLKGQRCGNAAISDKHANFIVNLGGGTAWDVEWLIRLMQNTVADRFGILLEPEVRIVGDYARGQAVPDPAQEVAYER